SAMPAISARASSSVAVVAMDEDARAEMAGIALRVGDVVAMRQQHHRKPAPRRDRVGYVLGPARRVDHGIAARPRDEKGMSSPGVPRIKAEAEDAFRHGLGENIGRRIAQPFGMDRSGR